MLRTLVSLAGKAGFETLEMLLNKLLRADNPAFREITRPEYESVCSCEPVAFFTLAPEDLRIQSPPFARVHGSGFIDKFALHLEPIPARNIPFRQAEIAGQQSIPITGLDVIPHGQPAILFRAFDNPGTHGVEINVCQAVHQGPPVLNNHAFKPLCPERPLPAMAFVVVARKGLFR